MKICLASPYDFSADGGVNKHIFYLARALREAGDEVSIIGPQSGVADSDDIDVTSFGGVVALQGNGSQSQIGVFTSPLAVARYMRRRSFDVLHVHEPLVPSLPYYALWTTKAPAKLCTFHCYAEAEAPLSRMTRKALSPVLRSFQRGIAVSNSASRFAQVAWSRPLSIIPNGVDTRSFLPEGARPEARREGRPVKLLFVGRWSEPRKGLPVLLDAFARLRARGVDATLDVIGEGDGSMPMPSLRAGVSFLGRTSEAELRRRVRECDVFVAPSTGQESFGIVLVEAMASGRALVCSDIDGYRDVAIDEGAVLVPPRDPVALADALAALCANPARRRAMGVANRAASLKYDWAEVAARLRDEYLLALDRPTPERRRARVVVPATPSQVAKQAAQRRAVP